MSEASVHLPAGPEEPKDFKCSYCGREFGVMRSLRRHENIHTGKLHRCDICHKGFTDPWILRRHIMIHERIGKVKPAPVHYNCNQCQLTFSSKKDLEGHLCVLADKVAQKKKTKLYNKKIGKANLIKESMNESHMPSNRPLNQNYLSSNIPGESMYTEKWFSPIVFACQFCGVSFLDKIDWKLHEEQEKIKMSESSSSNISSDDFIKNLVEGDNASTNHGPDSLVEEGSQVESLVKQGNAVRKSVIVSVGKKKTEQPSILDKFCSVLSPPSSVPSPPSSVLSPASSVPSPTEWMVLSPPSFSSESPTSDLSLDFSPNPPTMFPSSASEMMVTPGFSFYSPPNSPNQSSLDYAKTSQLTLNYSVEYSESVMNYSAEHSESSQNYSGTSDFDSSLNYTEYSESSPSLNYAEPLNLKDRNDGSFSYDDVENNQWFNNNSQHRGVKVECDTTLKDYSQIKKESFSS